LTATPPASRPPLFADTIEIQFLASSTFDTQKSHACNKQAICKHKHGEIVPPWIPPNLARFEETSTWMDTYVDGHDCLSLLPIWP
jgi:hypothetical protein